MRLATSLKDRTTPAHVIVQRLTSSYPADRLSKAITNLGRIIKTEYILRYLTDPELRRRVQRQRLEQGGVSPEITPMDILRRPGRVSHGRLCRDHE